MKYILLTISVIIVLYSGYITIRCLESINTLTQYGKGYLVGNVILLLMGIFILIFSIKKLKHKKNTL